MKPQLISLLMTVMSAAVLAGCGFQPVHGTGANLESRDDISVSEIDGRIGHELRKALQARLSTGIDGIPAGSVLSVVIEDRLARLSLQPDAAALRTDLRGRATYTLETEMGPLVGTVLAESSFVVPDAPHGDIAAQTAARERVASLLAERIVTDIRLKLAAGRGD